MISAGIWALCFAGSFLHGHFAAPTGDGFARGLNIIVIFMAWQIAAGLFAVVTLILRMVWSKQVEGAARWLGFVPIVISAGLVLFVVGWLAYAE
ncbi:MAG: hypothetical protein AAF439_06835 [Pseudomonadota bacterium]